MNPQPPLPVSSKPPGTALPDLLPTLASIGNTEENGSGQTAGLFALLLGQLTIEEPSARPVISADASGFSTPGAPRGDRHLPVPGNLLPPATAERPVDPALPPLSGPAPLTGAGTAAPAPGHGELLPLPVMPQPMRLQPEPAKDAIVRPAPRAVPSAAPSLSVTVAVADPATTTSPATAERQPPAPAGQGAPSLPITADEAAIPGPIETVVQPPKPLLTGMPVSDGATIAAPASTIAPGQPLTAGPSAATPTVSAPVLPMDNPVVDARWSQELGQRLLWMNDNGIGRAELRLNPPELGLLDVRITVANDEARVTFTAQHGATRDAIESAIPRLREMFANQGINLGDAEVSRHSQGDGQQATSADDPAPGRQNRDGDTFAGSPAEDDPAMAAVLMEGLIDTYA